MNREVLSIVDVSPKHRKRRKRVARSMGASLKMNDEVTLTGRRIRYFRDAHYDVQMRQSLKRRLGRIVGQPVEVTAIIRKSKLVGLRASKLTNNQPA